MPTLLFNKREHPEVTFDDVFLVPGNQTALEVWNAASPEQRIAVWGEGAQFQSTDILCHAELQAFRSRLLSLAEELKLGQFISRDDVDLTPHGKLAKTPIIISNMSYVTGKRMAEKIGRVGGIAAIPQDKRDDELVPIIEYMRSRHPDYDTPVSITPHTKVHEFRRLLKKRSHDTAVVVDSDGCFQGVLHEKDISEGINADISIEPYIHRDDIVTARDGVTPLEAIAIMDRSHIHYLPILARDGDHVVGVLTKIDAAMRLRYEPNVDAERGGLRAMYAVGALNRHPLDRVKFLLDHGVRDILLDVAHFDQGIQTYRNIEQVRGYAEQHGISLNLAAGNVVTREAVRNIIAAGAQYVKGGIGPGAMCTTRMETGVGRPQVSMILECADEAHRYGGFLISDGGVQYARDVAISIAAGADYVMSGTPFAGTYESPPDMQYDEQGRPYKVNAGMASTRLSVLRALGRQSKNPHDIFRDIVGHRSEGISASQVYVKPGMESAALVHHKFMDGLTSSITYAGARSVREFSEKAIIGIQTRNGFAEGQAKPRF